MDKIPAVRVQAIAALQRLQETTDPSDPILVQYLKLMNTDTNKYVAENQFNFTQKNLIRII